MRNWNFFCMVYLVSMLPDFILPMRNWNLNKEMTKEERGRILSYLWGIETYYCWSNFKAVSGILSYLWGIETQFFLNILLLILLDFILPMRNWNRRYCHVIPVTTNDFILPMRNWNKMMQFKGRKIKWDFILPMRNWNDINGKEAWIPSTRFYLTYEELKH